MHIKKIFLSSFRNYRNQSLEFQSGINCIAGANGSGKSNLLEALYLLSTGKSFRTHKLLDLAPHKEPSFHIQAEFLKDGIAQTLSLSLSGSERRLLHNQTSYTNFLPLLGLIPSVLLSPEDISILQGTPAERRRFLDIHLAQVDPLYVHHLGRYQRSLKQRNALLKARKEKSLTVWEELMALSAEYVVARRYNAIQQLNQLSQPHVRTFSKTKETFSMSYASSLPLETAAYYKDTWKKTRNRDLEYQTTQLGPHRDEITFLLQEQNIRSFGSEGQKRCCLMAIKLAEWELLQELLQFPPIFAIDDFGAHLDEERSQLLHRPLQSMGQVFLTAPNFSDLSPSITIDDGNTHCLLEIV